LDTFTNLQEQFYCNIININEMTLLQYHHFSQLSVSATEGFRFSTQHFVLPNVTTTNL